MTSSLKTGCVKPKKVTILLPYMKEDYLLFKMFDVLRLNKICPYLNNEDIKVDLINPNEDCESEMSEGIDLMKRLAEGFSANQGLLKEILGGSGNLRIRNILKKLIGRLNLSDNQIVFYYQPYFKKNLYTHLVILKEIKRNFRNITLVCSGDYFDQAPGTVLKKYDFIDYIPYWNCYDFAVKTMKGISKNEIKGISYLEDGNVVMNPDPVSDFNKGLMPNHFFITKNPGIVPIEYAMGCPHSCYFCDLKRFQKEFKIKNIDLLVKEVEFYAAQGVHYFWFLGSAINVEEDHLRGFCKAIIKKDLEIKWGAPLIPSKLQKSTYDLLYKAGCIHLRMGIETVNEKVLKLFGKNVTLESIEIALRYCQETNIKNTLTFMVGLPKEEEADLVKKMVFIKKYRNYINSVQLFIFQLRVGAPAYNSSLEFGLRIRDNKNGDQRHVEYDEINGLSWEGIHTKQKIMLDQCELFLKKNKIPAMSPEEYFIKLSGEGFRQCN